MPNKDRVLILDDEVYFTDLVKKSLEALGVEVVECNDAYEAISIITESDEIFDLVISDIDMPKLSGFQFIEELKKRQDYYNVPIVFITAMNNETVIQKAYQKDVLEVITKPIKLALFNARIQSYLNNFRLIKYSSFIRSKGSFKGTDLHLFLKRFSKDKLNIIMFINHKNFGNAKIEITSGDLTSVVVRKNKEIIAEDADAFEKIEKWIDCSYIIYDASVKSHKSLIS